MLKIYNSLTQQKEIFKPITPNKVKMYACGPTVYDYCHIGNARSFTAFDIAVRYLKFLNYEVTYVRNITDVDDKIIKRAEEKGQDTLDIVKFYTQAFHHDMDSLSLLRPDHEPCATHVIPEMIALIQKLIEKNYAYVADNGDVYYAVRHFAQYGCLSHRNIDELESGARVEINDVKRDPLDFVLWKLAKPNEPKWESPWGLGRPGWHIECSAMSSLFLGDHFDIHGGGKDLIFPHHENELAQSEAASGKKFVNYWMHAGYLQIEKEKMSKSLGNFLTIHDLLKEHANETLRYFLISGHYRSSLHYSQSALQHAHQALARLYLALRGLTLTSPPKDSLFLREFKEAMDDDFNTPIALAVLFKLAHEIQRLREAGSPDAASFGALLVKLGNVLGILQNQPEDFLKFGKDKLDVNKVETLIIERNRARSEKNWAEADRIRKALSDLSIVLEDSADGTTWRIISE